MSNSSNKRARIASPPRGGQPAPAVSIKEELDLLHNQMVNTSGPTSGLLTAIVANRSLVRTGGMTVADASGFPEYYLPPFFSRHSLPNGDRVILFKGRTKVTGKRLRALTAAILTTAIGASEYWIDEEGSILIQARYSTSATHIYFSRSKSSIVKGDDPYPLVTYIRDIIGTETSPRAEQLCKLLGKIRVIHKGKKSSVVLEALTALVNEHGAESGLVEGLSSTEKDIPVLCSMILGCIASQRVVDSVLATALQGQIDVDLLYRIMRATDFSLPLKAFTSNQGLDARGAPLVAQKLDECEEDDNVIIMSKTTTSKDFRAFSGDSLVFVQPQAGVFRRDGKRDGRPNYKLIDVDTMLASDLQRVALAVRATQAPHSHEEEKTKDEEIDLEALYDLSDSDDAEDLI
jgi:hypothetical protein